MSSFNKVILMGNVTRDLAIKTLPSGQKVVEIGLAVNRTYTQDGEKKEEVTFIDVTFWGKQAETLGQYLQKGNPLLIEGRLKLETWDQEGSKRQKLKVIGESFQFIGSKKDDSEGVKATKKLSPKKELSDEEYLANQSDDEIPF